MSPKDGLVELTDVHVLQVRALPSGNGPSGAFRALQSKLLTLRGRAFYGASWPTPAGTAYYACVARSVADDPLAMHLETGLIPGGWYARRKVPDWETRISQLPGMFEDMVRRLPVDPARPRLELYRCDRPMQLLVPTLSAAPVQPAPGFIGEHAPDGTDVLTRHLQGVESLPDPMAARHVLQRGDPTVRSMTKGTLLR